jgi:DNA helicase-2/ATP-dependent DNA helicase PcrA
VWAVASRHNLYRDTRGEWPKSLVDYCPEYRSGVGRRQNPQNLCAALRQASILRESSVSAPADILNLITIGLTELLRRHGIRDPSNQRVSTRTLWRTLAQRDPALPLRVRRLILDRVLQGTAAWVADTWTAFCRELHNLIGIAEPHGEAAVAFMRRSGRTEPAASRRPAVQDAVFARGRFGQIGVYSLREGPNR